jgi:hypothetical protein
MFAATVEAGKLERALDLVERLHIEKSFDLAMTIANNYRKLVDLIEDAKVRKFATFGGDEDEPEYTDAESPLDRGDYSLSHQRISPDAEYSRSAKRSFEDACETTHEAARLVRQKQGYH